MKATRLPALLLLLCVTVAASAADLAGTYTADELVITVESTGAAGAYRGTIQRGDATYPFTAVAEGDALRGQFTASDAQFPFTLTLKGDGVVFQTGQTTRALQRKQPANPFDAPAPAANRPANPLDQAEAKPDAPAQEAGDQPQPQQPRQQQSPPASPLDGAWTDGYATYRVDGQKVVVTYADAPDRPVNATLQVSGDRLVIRFADAAEQYRFRVEGDRLLLTDEDGDTEALRRIAAVPAPREDAAATATEAKQPAADSDRPRDARLVGSWRYTETFSDPVSGMSMASDTRMIIQADGTYLYGAGKTAGGGAGTSAQAASDWQSAGQWYTDNQVIYYREGTAGPWQPFARYHVEGNRMLLTYPDGSKKVWQRQ